MQDTRMIHKYGIVCLDDKLTIWACTGPNWIKDGFYLPMRLDETRENDDLLLKQIEMLEVKYGLPVAPATIMNHFNRELLPEVEPEKELFGMLFEAAKECQAILAEYVRPGSGIEEHATIGTIMHYLDNKNLVSAMREYEKQKA